MNPDSKKLKVAKSSLDYIKHDCVLGVGTGSTVNFLIDLLPDLINKIQAVVSSSDESTKRLEAHGIEVSNLNNIGNIDLYIDGIYAEGFYTARIGSDGKGELAKRRCQKTAIFRFDFGAFEAASQFQIPIRSATAAIRLVWKSNVATES